jgi:hypothetical protein
MTNTNTETNNNNDFSVEQLEQKYVNFCEKHHLDLTLKADEQFDLTSPQQLWVDKLAHELTVAQNKLDTGDDKKAAFWVPLPKKRASSQSQDVFASLVEEIKSASEEIDIDDLNARPLSLDNSNNEKVEVTIVKTKKPSSFGLTSTKRFKKLKAKRDMLTAGKISASSHDEGPTVAVGENLSLFNN